MVSKLAKCRAAECRAAAARCEEEAKKARNRVDRERQMLRARAYRILAAAEAERAVFMRSRENLRRSSISPTDVAAA
jgi:hypothetical protein